MPLTVCKQFMTKYEGHVTNNIKSSKSKLLTYNKTKNKRYYKVVSVIKSTLL